MSEVDDELLEAIQARVGRTLRDKWTLDRLIGVGGMAAVYAATHRNRSHAAIKILHQGISLDRRVRERFLREGYVANTIGHPGAVRVIDDDVNEDGSAFLVMELLEGETIEARRKRKGGILDTAEALTIADQLLDVLAAAHAKDIVHRDLKPENLFLNKDGQLKVLDFGIARLRTVDAPRSGTQTGHMLGTPAYMPPEQARGRWVDVDARSDLWAVGASLFHLLTGRFVHEAETPNEILAKAINETAPKIRTLVPTLPEAVAAVIDRALAYDRQERFSDARAMQQAVHAARAALKPGDEPREPMLSLPQGAVGESPAAIVSLAQGEVLSVHETSDAPVAPAGPLTTVRAVTASVSRLVGTLKERLLALPQRILIAAATIASLATGIAVVAVVATGRHAASVPVSEESARSKTVSSMAGSSVASSTRLEGDAPPERTHAPSVAPTNGPSTPDGGTKQAAERTTTKHRSSPPHVSKPSSAPAKPLAEPRATQGTKSFDRDEILDNR